MKIRNWKRWAVGLAVALITAGALECAGVPGDSCPTPGATKKLDDGHTYTCQQSDDGHNTWGGY